MARRAPPPSRRPAAVPEPWNLPFAELRKRVRVRAAVAKARPAPVSPPPVADEPELFVQAMADVVPLAPDARGRVDGPAPAVAPRPRVSEEAEALAALSDLVTGATSFDVTETREYVEGTVVGLDPRLVRRLRRGDFAWQGHLDLHGLTAPAARAAVEGFLVQAVRAGRRCVLIVHGRGLNSKDRTPVLKERLKSWLARGQLARCVLAFATARPCDGGAGALYVLLRRDRRRRPIQVREGAKR